VKHLLTNEWEFFLSGVLQAVESAGAFHTAAASHKASNPWYKAFHAVYGGVASDCSVPTGKNRYHKFKDKIVEIWAAMENTASHPQRDMAIRQLDTYRLACETKQAERGLTPSTAPKTISPKQSSLTPGKRPATTSAGLSSSSSKRPHLSNTIPSQTWTHLDEAKVLASIPQPLLSLIHLRHCGVEVQSTDTQLVEDSYQRALNEFLDGPTTGKSAAELFVMCQSMIVLWRCAKRIQKTQESKAILYTYHNLVQEYLQAVAMAGEEQETTGGDGDDAAAAAMTDNV
jgi:hypothetical protein